MSESVNKSEIIVQAVKSVFNNCFVGINTVGVSEYIEIIFDNRIHILRQISPEISTKDNFINIVNYTKDCLLQNYFNSEFFEHIIKVIE